PFPAPPVWTSPPSPLRGKCVSARAHTRAPELPPEARPSSCHPRMDAPLQPEAVADHFLSLADAHFRRLLDLVQIFAQRPICQAESVLAAHYVIAGGLGQHPDLPLAPARNRRELRPRQMPVRLQQPQEPLHVRVLARRLKQRQLDHLRRGHRNEFLSPNNTIRSW